MQNINEFNQDLLAFLEASPTPFHAVSEMVRQFSKSGFTHLDEGEEWLLQEGKAYFVVRNGSSVVAFTAVHQSLINNGFRMVGAHTDSPCLKVKPHPEINSNGYFQLGVEVYGGALLNPWFDRDLSLAGRVVFKDTGGKVNSTLINYQRAIASIPSLAIHLDREANTSRTVNPQMDIPPILMKSKEDKISFRSLLLSKLQHDQPESNAEQVMDYELSFYDTQPPAIIGLEKEFIASARLDNLLSCFVGMKALIESAGSEGSQSCVLVCNDHEEVGSMSATGAQGPMLESVLRRIVNSDDDLLRTMSRSMMISADNAHGIHPNFSNKHDANHGPILNGGPVIKVNANQRYATDSETSSIFRHICEVAKEPVQSFVVRTDMACGSTIGPITASALGVKTIDVGVPTFGMHSVRETGGSKDAYSLFRILKTFNAEATVVIT
jgi:aspartyl aminopeptidase